MSRFRSTLAIMMAMVMILTSVPAFAQQSDTSSAEVDEVVYNLGNYPITVGTDEKQARDKSWQYKLFDKDGNYNIQLETNAFFPYEVQFTYDGDVFTEWFETPNSTVTVGEHEFRVSRPQQDDGTLSQIGVTVDGHYIPAYPKEKEFTDGSGVMRYAMIPLENYEEVTLDLRAYHRFQLKNVGVETILNGVNYTSDGAIKVAWARTYADDYTVVAPADELDMSRFYDGTSLDLIVGSAKQLDENNTLYKVYVRIDDEFDFIIDDISVTKKYQGVETEVPLYVKHDEGSIIMNSESPNRTHLILEHIKGYFDKEYLQADSATVKFTINPIMLKDATVSIYPDSYETVEKLDKAIADKKTAAIIDNSYTVNLLEQDKSDSELHVNKYFTILYEKKGKKYLVILHLGVYENDADVDFDIYSVGNRDKTAHNDTDWDWDDENDCQIVTYTLRPGLRADVPYDLTAQLYYNAKYLYVNRVYVQKAVVGLFDSLEAAKNEIDIKDKLFYRSEETNKWIGYKARYDGEGQKFTIFADNGTVKVIVKVKESEEEPEEPEEVLGTPHRYGHYFNVYDVLKNNNNYDNDVDTYQVGQEDDSYSAFGYQTLLTTDDVDLSQLKARYSVRDDAKVYAGHAPNAGAPQKSGETVQDFSKGAVQYTANNSEGKNPRNYWVSVIKKHIGGAKLFVNGINTDAGLQREVYLINTLDNMHNIFIANIGDKELTGLNARLENPQHVKLDEFWTVGGEHNDKLSAFVTTERQHLDGKWVKNGELVNIAKIRLLPDGEGEVSGTLVLSADGQPDMRIELIGASGDPHLTTDTIPEAVKYVPYAVQLMNNNKYPWNKTSIKMTEGKLPEGMTLKEDGEIYGVPRETGEFTFTVKMKNSYDEFGSDEQEYTLIVKDNTNANVNGSSDTGYILKEAIGQDINGDRYVDKTKDELFVSEGEFSQFVDFWLNGEKLVDGTDYTKEEGSTKITILSQTFKNKANVSGRNTIAAEFRNDKHELKRTAQNFVLEIKNNGDGSNNNTSNNNSNQSGSNDNTSNGNTSNGNSSGEGNSNQSGSGDNISNNNGSNDNSSNNTTEQSSSRNKRKKKKKSSSSGSTSNATNTTSINRTVKKPVVVQPTVSHLVVQVDSTKEGDTVQIKVSDQLINDALASKLNRNKNVERTIKLVPVGASKNAKKVAVTLSKDSLRKMATDPDLTLSAGVDGLAEIKLSHNALVDLAKYDGELTLSMNRTKNMVDFDVSVGGKRIDTIRGNIKVSIPKLAKGDVIVLVRSNGKEEIVKKSLVQNGDVYALLKGSGTVKVIPNKKAFGDVSRVNKFYDSVMFVSSHELFAGIGDNEFGTELPMSRAMIAMVLYGLDDKPDAGFASVFTDVPAGQWYSDAVVWANKKGLVSGYLDKRFGVDDSITKEQLFTILYKFAQNNAIATNPVSDLNGYLDYDNVSDYATEAMRWATDLGIASDNNRLDPKKQVSRGEVAVIMHKMIEQLVK